MNADNLELCARLGELDCLRILSARDPKWKTADILGIVLCKIVVFLTF